jgi:hypothetical protein
MNPYVNEDITKPHNASIGISIHTHATHAVNNATQRLTAPNKYRFIQTPLSNQCKLHHIQTT